MADCTFTLPQYQALLKAYASGTTRVTMIDGGTVEYRSLSDLAQVLSTIKTDLQACGLLPANSPPGPVRRLRLLGTKGL